MRRAIILTAALALLFVSGCTDKYKTKEELFKEGVRVLDANNPSGAIIAFKKALEKDQNYFEARLQLAKAYREVGKLDSAENELQKVVRQSPSSMEVHVELGKLALLKDRPDEAIKEVSPYIANENGGTDAIEVAGWAYAIKGDYPRSVELLKKILPDRKLGDKAELTLSKVYAKMGRLDEAYSQIQDLIKKKPSNKEALVVLGDVQTKKRDLDGAIRTYDRITEMDPWNIEYASRKTLLLIAKGDYSRALSESDSIITRFPGKPEGYMLNGIVHYYTKDLVEAAAQLERSVSIAPIPAAYYYLGLTHYAKGEPEQAITSLRRAKAINPAYSDAGILSATILLNKKMPDDAVDEIQKVLAKDDNNATAHDILGSAYIAKGMFEEGIKEIDRAIELDPHLVKFQIQKGFIELEAGRFKEAETSLTAAVSVDPELLQSRIALASYYSRRGEYDMAVKILQQGINGKRTDAALYALAAEAMDNQGRRADAVRHLEKAKQAEPGNSIAYFKLASLYLKGGEPARAVGELKSFADRAPGEPRAYLTIAGILDAKGDKKGALEYYTKAMETGRVEGRNGLARFYVKENRADEAIAVLDGTIKSYPLDPAARQIKGAALLLKKKYADAIEAFEKAERFRPGAGLPLVVNAYVSMGRPDKAIDRIDMELVRQPGRLDLLVEKSKIYMEMGRMNEAVVNAKRLVETRPDSPAGYITLARLYQREGRLDKAIGALSSEDAGRLPGLVTELGALYAQKKDYSSALAQFKRAERMDPKNAAPVFEGASVLERMGKRREARAEYQRVLAISRDHLAALNNLAYLCAQDDVDLAFAMQLATRAAALAPNSGPVQDTLGLVFLKNKKAEEAVKALERASSLSPGKPEILYHLGLAYRARGDRARAAQSIQKALKLGEFQDSGQARELLGSLTDGARG